MTELPSSRFASCACGACGPQLSRRAFLCTGAAGAVAAPALAAAITPAAAQQGPAQQAPAPQAPAAPGRPILIKGGCVLTLDRAVGDFDQADVLIEGGKISAMRP